MADDRYQHHDYYLMDELLTEEHKLIRQTVRDWVKKEVVESIKFAEESPLPDPEEIYQDVYQEPNYPFIKEYLA